MGYQTNPRPPGPQPVGTCCEARPGARRRTRLVLESRSEHAGSYLTWYPGVSTGPTTELSVELRSSPSASVVPDDRRDAGEGDLAVMLSVAAATAAVLTVRMPGNGSGRWRSGRSSDRRLEMLSEEQQEQGHGHGPAIVMVCVVVGMVDAGDDVRPAGQLLDRGILINRTQDTVCFLPPYIIQKAHVTWWFVPWTRAGLHPRKKHLTSDAKSEKEPTTLSSQPFQTTQVATPPATATFPGRDLISIRDLSPIEIETIFHLAGLLKARPSNFRSALAGKQMVMFFEKQSLRTRLTFEAGMASMGGNAFFMDQTAGRLDAREKLSDIAHNVERWVDAIVLRTYSTAQSREWPSTPAFR